MGTAYARFLYILDHLNGVISEYDGQREHAIQSLLYRWKLVYSPVYASAFFRNPFYSKLRPNLTHHYGALFVELGMGNLRVQCHTALALMARRHDDLDGTELLCQFLDFCVHQEAVFKEKVAISTYQPRIIWSQIGERWPLLTLVLGRMYCGTGSSAGVERQHKTSKRVRTSVHNRTGSSKVKRQVAVAYNSATSRGVLPSNRQPFEHVIAVLRNRAAQFDTGLLDNELLLAVPRQHGDGGAEDLEGDIDPVDLLLDDFELAEQNLLASHLRDVESSDNVLDFFLFIHHELDDD